MLAPIAATLADVPADAAGTGFLDDEDREIVQFTGVGEMTAARTLIERIAELNASCDDYILQVAERGSLAVVVPPQPKLEAPPTDDLVTTAWERRLLSEHLREVQVPVGIAAGGVVTFLGFTGNPPLSEAEIGDVIAAAAARAEEAGQCAPAPPSRQPRRRPRVLATPRSSATRAGWPRCSRPRQSRDDTSLDPTRRAVLLTR